MRKKHAVKLTDEERQWLELKIKTGSDTARKLVRCRILLKASQEETGWPDRRIAEALECSVSTIEQVRRRFAAGGLAPALERRGQPLRPEKRTLDGAAEAQLIQLACSPAPDGRAQWTLALLGEHLVQLKTVESVSQPTLCRVLKKMNLSPG
jgi:transposase